jgi:hypothetical protein
MGILPGGPSRITVPGRNTYVYLYLKTIKILKRRIQKMYFAKFPLKDFKKCEFQDSMTNLRNFDCDVSLATWALLRVNT